MIHAGGPRCWDGRRQKPALLVACYRDSQRPVAEHGFWTIAFPAISCGVYGYSINGPAMIAARAVAVLLSNDQTIEQVIFAWRGTTLPNGFKVATRPLADR